MSRINIECHNDGADLVSFDPGINGILTLVFNKGYNGYISVGHISARIVGKECSIGTKGLEDGDYIPKLVLCDRVINLPPIKKENGAIIPIKPDTSYLSELSIRQRRLEDRVNCLSSMVEEMYKKVFGTTLF